MRQGLIGLVWMETTLKHTDLLVNLRIFRDVFDHSGEVPLTSAHSSQGLIGLIDVGMELLNIGKVRLNFIA